jgi:ABC-type Zn uptake system ZnuABC Zn-binding protein ZnuA
MLTYNEIKNTLLSNPPTKVAITGGSEDIPIYGAETGPANPHIWVFPHNGNKFKITEQHTIKILP